MTQIELFDPAMCCSTGVCGPAIDPELMRVATALNTLTTNGCMITRHNLASEPQNFVANKAVSELLQKEGADALPITLLNGNIVKTREYPSNEELEKWSGIRIETPEENGEACCCECCEGRCC